MAIAVWLTENPMKVATVTAQSFPHLRAGALRDFERYVYAEFASAIAKYHKTEHVFSFTNGSIIEFKTYETEYDARGAKRDLLFINEANTFDYMTYFQLDSRSYISIMDYNPTIRFWCHDKVIGESGTAFRISDHRHNPFLTEEKHAEIEAICTFDYNEDGTIKLKKDEFGNDTKEPVVLKGDYELWKVYARGLTGNVAGVIYPDWSMIEELPDEKDNNWVYAVDYGYTNDPTAIIKLCRRGEDVYVHEVAYQTGGMHPRAIKAILTANGYLENRFPFYSEHDGDMIKQLRLLGILAVPARKGQGSINAGIEKIKEYRIHYTAASRNIKRELGMYVWLQDDRGNSTNVPIDANNHALDAIRYAIYTHFYRGKT